MEKRWTLIRALLLVMSFFSFQSASIFAQSTVFLISPNWKQTPLTHTVFHGSNHHCAAAPLTVGEENIPDGFTSIVGKGERGPFPWKYKIIETVFWVGEQATEGNPVSNVESAWDPSWVAHYGGEDNPDSRANFLPVAFTPKQNPFYVALPYNDVDDHHTKPEAAKVIPWFNDSFVRDGQSVCKDRWVAIRHGKRTCYAQWEDVGPFQIDHWQYVFGNERPRPNANQDAGIDVSRAVREYLGMSGWMPVIGSLLIVMRFQTGLGCHTENTQSSPGFGTERCQLLSGSRRPMLVVRPRTRNELVASQVEGKTVAIPI